jgi:purine nucleosidase
MANQSNSRLKVIIDTDIGDDIDDAFALYLAIRSPELDIAGITTVFKNTYQRAQIVANLLRVAGRSDIPVVAGAKRPIVSGKIYGVPIPFDQKPHQFLEEMSDESVDESMNAAQFIIQTVKASDTPITLITLGALTNVAIALMAAPEIATNIEKIVIMGGAFDLNISEYNFSCDPEAAHVVLAAGIPTLIVGLDVTFKCELSEEQVAALRSSPDPIAGLIMRMREYWDSQHIYLHDPLAVAVAYRQDFVKLGKRKIDIELKGEYTRGMSINLSGINWHQDTENSHIWVCTDVDAAGFTEFYVNRVLQLNGTGEDN